jgi:phospholipid-binding lipoprotein MlaA
LSYSFICANDRSRIDTGCQLHTGVADVDALGYNRAAVRLSGKNGSRVLIARTLALLILVGVTACPCDAGETGESRVAATNTAESSAADADAYDPLFDDLDEEYADIPTGFPDPLESVNRKTLALNGVVDRWLLDPLTEAYGWIMPRPLKDSLRNFFANISSVTVFANELFQFEFERAGLTFSRLLVNSTAGAFGLLDPATEFGIESSHADFGQTLAKAGVGSGPYLIIPVLGPTDLRDGVGDVTDSLLHPLAFFLGLGFMQRLTYGGSAGLSTREANYEALKALSESSLDYYAALRNAYYQARIAEIWEGQPAPEPRRRICDSMRARLSRQPWRVPVACRGTPG